MEYPQLKASLYKKIEEWIDENCESDECQDSGMYWGTETAEHMTTAALAVFSGAADCLRYAEQEEVFKD